MPFDITNIKRFINKTNELVEIIKREDKNDCVTLLPKTENNQEEIHIPWVNNEAEFESRTIEVKYKKSKTTIYIWQHGDKIRYSESGYEAPGSAIPGNKPNSGGDKVLEIEEGYVVLN
jgi:hypothetical protein